MMRILVVEDEERLVCRLARVLDGEGYATQTVDRSAERGFRSVILCLAFCLQIYRF